MSIEDLQQKWRVRWPNLQESISRLVGAALAAGALIFAGWALQRNGALGGFATFVTVAGSSLIAGLFRPERGSFDDLDPRSLRAQLMAWARNRVIVAWLATPKVWRAFGAIGFGALVVVIEEWVHTWFGEDPAHPSLAVTLVTLAIVLVPTFTWTGYVAEKRFGRSDQVDELGAIFTERIHLPIASTVLGRSLLFAVIRTGITIVFRVLAVFTFPIIFNTEQAAWAAACILAIIVVYHDTIFDTITHGPTLLKRLQALMTENTELKEQVATLRAQVAVFQSARPAQDIASGE